MKWQTTAYSALASLCLWSSLVHAQDAAEAPAEQEESSALGTVKDAKSKVDEQADALRAKAPGILGDLRIGPHVGVGIPHPLTVGLDLVYADLLSLSVEGGRTKAEIQDVEVEIRNWDVALRWFPFRGTFFLGAAYGDQGIVAKSSQDVEIDYNGIPLNVPTTFRLEVESKYLTPQLGWYARWDSGFTLSFELGLQMPSGSSSELQTSFKNISSQAEEIIRNNSEYNDSKDKVEDVGRLIGQKKLPYISLLKFGWLF